MTEATATVLNRAEIAPGTGKRLLQQLITRLGIPKAALLLGVHPVTVRQWNSGKLRYGPSRGMQAGLLNATKLTDLQVEEVLRERDYLRPEVRRR